MKTSKQLMFWVLLNLSVGIVANLGQFMFANTFWRLSPGHHLFDTLPAPTKLNCPEILVWGEVSEIILPGRPNYIKVGDDFSGRSSQRFDNPALINVRPDEYIWQFSVKELFSAKTSANQHPFVAIEAELHSSKPLDPSHQGNRNFKAYCVILKLDRGLGFTGLQISRIRSLLIWFSSFTALTIGIVLIWRAKLSTLKRLLSFVLCFVICVTIAIVMMVAIFFLGLHPSLAWSISWVILLITTLASLAQLAYLGSLFYKRPRTAPHVT